MAAAEAAVEEVVSSQPLANSIPPLEPAVVVVVPEHSDTGSHTDTHKPAPADPDTDTPPPAKAPSAHYSSADTVAHMLTAVTRPGAVGYLMSAREKPIGRRPHRRNLV